MYREGKLAGYAKLTSVTLGAQIGGQTFSEVIFFKDRFAFDKFTAGQLVISASAGAVSGKEGGQNLGQLQRRRCNVHVEQRRAHRRRGHRWAAIRLSTAALNRLTALGD